MLPATNNEINILPARRGILNLSIITAYKTLSLSLSFLLSVEFSQKIIPYDVIRM
jgi:hypothetical protein